MTSNHIHDHIAAALANALSPEERAAFDAHLHACPACFDAWTEAKDADRALLRTLAPLHPSDNLEQSIITSLQEPSMKFRNRPLIKKTGYAIAASLALAATAAFANFALHQNYLPNPFKDTFAQSDAPTLTNTFREIASVAKYGREAENGRLIQSLQGGDGLDGLMHSRGEWSDQQKELAHKTIADTVQGQNAGEGIKDELSTQNHFPEQAVRQLQEQTAAADQSEKSLNLLADTERRDSTSFNGSITKAGGSTLDLSGTNTFNGDTTLAAGKLKITDGTRATHDKAHYFDTSTLATGWDDDHDGKDLVYNADFSMRASNEAGGKFENTAGEQFGNIKMDLHSQKTSGSPDPDRPQRPSHASVANTLGLSTNFHQVAATQPAASPSTQEPAAPSPAQKIIKSGNITFEVRSFDDASTTLTTIAAEEKGYVASTSSEKGANGKVTGTIVIRVPPENLERFLLKIRAIGDLKAQQVAAADVTKQYTDLESELRGLRTLESRLLDLIKTGKGEVKDLVEAEKQLGEYRIRIEKIEGEIRYYNNLVGMATLNITAYEKDLQKPAAAAEQENVALALQTEDVDTQYKSARQIITDAKGQVIDSELKQHDAGQLAANILATVPAEKADFVAVQLKQLGVVASFARDRKQTTSGGSGTADASLPVEKKDARFSIALYNLANIAPRQTTTLTLAVPDVEAAYKSIIAQIKKSPAAAQPEDNKNHDLRATQPAGKIVASSMNGEQAAQMAADIRADVQSDLADTLLQSIRAQGEVVSSASAENTDSPNVTATKRGIQLHIVNVAAVPARENQALRTVAANVPDSYNKLLATLQTAEAAGNARVLLSQLRQADSKSVAASLAFDIKRTALASVDKAVADAGIDYLARNVSKSQDPGAAANTLDSKVRIEISLTPADNLDPRRTTALAVEHDNVESAISSLRAALPADARELDYSITKEPSGRVSAHIVIDTPLLSAPALKATIKSLGGAERGNQALQNNQVPETRFARERIDLTLTSAKPLLEQDKGIATTLRAALASAATALLTSLYLVIVTILFLAPFALVATLIYKLLRRKKSPA